MKPPKGMGGSHRSGMNEKSQNAFHAEVCSRTSALSISTRSFSQDSLEDMALELEERLESPPARDMRGSGDLIPPAEAAGRASPETLMSSTRTPSDHDQERVFDTCERMCSPTFHCDSPMSFVSDATSSNIKLEYDAESKTAMINGNETDACSSYPRVGGKKVSVREYADPLEGKQTRRVPLKRDLRRLACTEIVKSAPDKPYSTRPVKQKKVLQEEVDKVCDLNEHQGAPHFICLSNRSPQSNPRRSPTKGALQQKVVLRCADHDDVKQTRRVSLTKDFRRSACVEIIKPLPDKHYLTGGMKLKKTRQAKEDICPAASLIAKLEAIPGLLSSSNASSRNSPRGSPNRDTHQRKVTELEVFLPQLKVSKGHVVCECPKPPNVKKRVLSHKTVKFSTLSLKREEIVKNQNEEVEKRNKKVYSLNTFHCAPTTVSRINEVLTNTINELKSRIDELLPAENETSLLKNKHKNNIVSRTISRNTDRGNKQANNYTSFKPKSSLNQQDSPKTNLGASKYVHKPDFQQKITTKRRIFVPQLASKTPTQNSWRKATTKVDKVAENNKIQDTTTNTELDKSEAKLSASQNPGSMDCVSKTSSKVNCLLSGKGYKDMYMEKIATKENTWKGLKQRADALGPRISGTAETAAGAKIHERIPLENVNIKIDDVSWMHRNLPKHLRTPKAARSS